MRTPEVINEVERAVRQAQRNFAMYQDEVRKLTRVEINAKTLEEITDWARTGFHGDVISYMRGEGPIILRDVSYYYLPALPVSWKIIAIGITTTGRPSARVISGP